MLWSETTASECRYGDVAGRIWGDWVVLWENSEAGYQGHATILAEKDGRYCFYEWWYGSCSGCDGWEADGFSDDQVEKEMRDTAIFFADRAELVSYLERLEGRAPLSNYSMERGGALAAGIDILSGGVLERLSAMRVAIGLPKIDHTLSKST